MRSWGLFVAVVVGLTAFFLLVPARTFFAILVLGSLASAASLSLKPHHLEIGGAWLRQYGLSLGYGLIGLLYLFLYARVHAYAELVTWNDSVVYHAITDRSLSDMNFWMGERPFTAPLFYKLVGGADSAIILMQWWVSVLAWLTLAYVVAAILKISWLKLPAFATILLFSLSIDLTLWNKVIHSESLAISLFALMLASWFWVLRWTTQPRAPRSQIFVGILLGGLAGLWSFTRDTHVYFLLGAAGILTGGMILGWRKTHPFGWLYVTLLIAVMGIFFGQDYTANQAQRWQFSLANVLGQRILPDPVRTLYFVERGMPYNQRVIDFEGEWAYTADYQATFGDWLMEGDSKRLYMRFLLSQPVTHTEEMLSVRHLLFDEDLKWYAHLEEKPLPDWQENLTAVFYLKQRPFERLAFIAVGLTLLFLPLWWEDGRWIVPMALFATVLPLAFIVWHGDALEVPRHAVGVNLQAHLALWLTFILAADSTIHLVRGGGWWQRAMLFLGVDALLILIFLGIL